MLPQDTVSRRLSAWSTQDLASSTIDESVLNSEQHSISFDRKIHLYGGTSLLHFGYPKIVSYIYHGRYGHRISFVSSGCL